MEGSPLFERTMARDPSDELMRTVWEGTPWMVDTWTGDDRRRQEIVNWCFSEFGRPSWPFSDNPIPGDWREGNACVFGWSWFGFATEDMMQQFRERWPPPADIAHQSLDWCGEFSPSGLQTAPNAGEKRR